MYVIFWELIIAFPDGGQWAPFSKVAPPGSNLELCHCLWPSLRSWGILSRRKIWIFWF